MWLNRTLLGSHFFCIQPTAIWKNTGLAQVCSWKREEKFNDIKLDNYGFLDNFGYFSLILRYRNAKSGSFLKAAMWTLNLYEWIFLLCPLKSPGLSCILKGSFTHTQLCNNMRRSVTGKILIGSLNYPNFPNVDACHYTIYFLKATFVNITNDLIRKLFKYVKLPNSQWQIQIFQNSISQEKAYVLSLVPNTVSCFPWIGSLNLFQEIST